MNVQIYSYQQNYTNEYPNIHINFLTRTNVRIIIARIFEYIRIFILVLHSNTLTNECPNIFVKEKLIRMNVRIYIRDQYIRIFEYSNIRIYSSHSGMSISKVVRRPR